MRLPIAITLIGACLACENARAQEIDANRLAKEAASLFHVVMSEEDAPRRCRYGVDWTAYPVPEDVAQKYFGLTVHAALAPPEAEKSRLRFQDILDPDGKHPDAFCTEAQSDASGGAQFAAFAADKSAHESVIDQASFTLPVFDAAYRKAIVIVEYSETRAAKIDLPPHGGNVKPGKVVVLPIEGSIFAKIYVKTEHGWQLEDRELVGDVY